MTEREELKPCRCGKGVELVELWSCGNQHCTILIRCEADGCHNDFEVRELTEEKACQKWNRRAKG